MNVPEMIFIVAYRKGHNMVSCSRLSQAEELNFHTLSIFQYTLPYVHLWRFLKESILCDPILTNLQDLQENVIQVLQSILHDTI
jgi:hypothetical protein